MNRREKIFVFAAAAAACFGLVNLFLLSPQGRTIGGTSLDKDGTGIFDRINADLKKLIQKEEKNDAQERIFSMIQSEWSKDPFEHRQIKLEQEKNISTDPARPPEKKKNIIPDFHYAGFIRSGEKILAIIDGLEYGTGEILQGSRFKIIGITPLKIILKREEDGLTTELPLREG